MKPSMKDIAREMHVSINAVSLALNNKPGVSAKMRGEIFECAQRMGYLQGKAKFQNIYAGKRIGLFVTQKNFTSRFYSRVISGIEQEAIKENYSILTRFLDNPEQWRADIKRDFFRGILIIGVAEEEVMKEIASYGIPVILVDERCYSVQLDSVVTQNRIGTFDAVTYLQNQGYRTVGFFGDYAFSHSNRERFWGYMEALTRGLGSVSKAAQMAVDYSIVGEINDLIITRDVEAIECLIRQHEKHLPEAFQCANDESAATLNLALKNLGYRIPEDISLIGFDDSDVGTIVLPKLTTLHVQRKRMGMEALQRMVMRIQHENKLPVTEIALPVNLVIRDSTYKKR